MNLNITKDQINSAISALKALADTIKQVGQIPSGHLYATIMQYVSLPEYEKMIDLLKRSGIIIEKSNLLIWNIKEEGNNK